MKVSYVAVICLLVVLCGSNTNVQGAPVMTKVNYLTFDDIKEVLSKIPTIERHNFLKYHLRLGYDLEEKKKHWPADVGDNFAIALYQYAKLRHVVMSSTMSSETTICFEDGTCVDIGDIGVHP